MVACSGGADSLALLAATVFEATEPSWQVIGATVDHGLQAGSAEHADRVAEQMRSLGVAESVTARVKVEAPGSRSRGSGARGALRRTRRDRGALLGPGRAARAHPRRPGGDGAPRADPWIGWSRVVGDATCVRGLPAPAARRHPRRHRDRVPGRGHRVLDRPAQRRPGVHPRAGADQGAAAARGGARPRGGRHPRAHGRPVAGGHGVPRRGGGLRRWTRRLDEGAGRPVRVRAGAASRRHPQPGPPARRRTSRCRRRPSCSTPTWSPSTAWSSTGTARSGSSSPATSGRHGPGTC